MLRLVDTECKKWDAKEFVTADNINERGVFGKNDTRLVCVKKGALIEKLYLT